MASFGDLLHDDSGQVFTVTVVINDDCLVGEWPSGSAAYVYVRDDIYGADGKIVDLWREKGLATSETWHSKVMESLYKQAKEKGVRALTKEAGGGQ